VRISDLMVYCPQVVELDVNPLLADARGVIALDARVRIAVAAAPPRLPLAIAPYPRDWHREITVEAIGAVDLRPIRPADETLYADFLAAVTPEDMRLRFFVSAAPLPP